MATVSDCALNRGEIPPLTSGYKRDMPYSPAFLDSLAGRRTVLPTAEAAQSLRRAYIERQRAQGLSAWQSPFIVSWKQLLESLWSEAVVSGTESRILLNAAQEHALWLDTLAAKPPLSALASRDALADLAASAWALAHAYGVQNRLRPSAVSHDARTFAQWAALFDSTCTAQQYMTHAQLEAALARHISAKVLTAPLELTLLGFPDQTPAALMLLESLRSAGTAIKRLQLPHVMETTHLVVATNESAELSIAASKAREILEKNPSARIAIVLPSIDDMLLLDSAFREVLAPELEFIGIDPSSKPWETSNIGPLSSQALVATALDLLHLIVAPLGLPKISALLISPYLNTPPSRLLSARFDVEVLRDSMLLRPEMDLRGLHTLAQNNTLAPTWITGAQDLIARSAMEKQRSFADWAEFSRTFLAAAKWPGTRTLNSIEYQAQQAFDGVLDLLSTLDFRGKRVPSSAFLQVLTRQCSDPFRPASTDAPIQVISLAAAQAQSFDHLILLQATDSNYPPVEYPDPLLSFALQAEQNMPGTNPERASERARQALRSLLHSSQAVTFLYAEQTANGEQRFSPFLSNIASPQTQSARPPHSEHPVDVIQAIEPPLPPLPSAEVPGGARVLKLQAACGFQAFAEMRLQSEELGLTSRGFDAMESGNILHNTMEAFWKEVKTQKALRAMSEEALTALLKRCIDASIPRRLVAETEWEQAYLQAQKDRLCQLLTAWLQKELDRSAFTVLDQERATHIDVGPLTLHVRIDRIDQLDNGGFVFVDYKTGSSVDPRQWDGERPDDPQLPLYALLAQSGELKGLAFARIRAGKDMKWMGVQSEEAVLPLSKPVVTDLDASIDEWRQTLQTLAEEFSAGNAAVNPKDITVNCRYCAQRLICRINPESFLTSTEEEEQTGEAGL